MANANPCAMKPHYSRTTSAGGGWNRELLGCLPKTPAVGAAPPPAPAPADLRGLPQPPGWDTNDSMRIAAGNTEYLRPLSPILTELTIHKNKLKELPALPTTLQFLNVEKNDLTAIPNLPPGLRTLNIRNNRISTLPEPIPGSLEALRITHNEITAIPSLAHTQVHTLGLGFNQLTAMPALPNTVNTIGVASNQIKSIKNLPRHVEVLVCSNNPLHTLEIANLTHLLVLIASNCGLHQLPLLPPVNDGNDDNNNNNNNNGNNNNDGGGANDGIEDRRTYHFGGNPLDPEYAAIYQTYLDDGNHDWQYWPNPAGGPAIYSNRRPGSTRAFRLAILEQYRRDLQKRKTEVGELIRMKQLSSAGPGQPTRGVPGALQANYGPMNLIGEFLTGKKGTIESQRLGLLENQERARAVPRGTAAQARATIADIGIGADPTASLAQQERAKLYVRRANLDAARAREAQEDEANRAALLAAQENENEENNNEEGNALNAGPLPHGPSEENFAGGKSRRQHTTPRNRKSKRQTRRR